jgi:hypothetical protein
MPIARLQLERRHRRHPRGVGAVKASKAGGPKVGVGGCVGAWKGSCWRIGRDA